MAWDFAAEIHNLTGYDADDDSGTAIDGTTFSLQADRWLVDGAKVVIQSIPGEMLTRCATRSTLSASAGTTLDLDGKGKILHVTRLSADSGGFEKACREIPGVRGDLSQDSNDMMNYATETDPVYWLTNNASGNPTLFVMPTPTNAQPSYVHHVSFPLNTNTWGTADGTTNNVLPNLAVSIPNFPDELEHLVVLYAAIKALEYVMLQEEDQEVYAPQLATLKQDYQQGIGAITTGLGKGPT